MKRITKTFTLLAALTAIVCLGACTRNNGNIGKQFGQWKVTHITVDGQTDANYHGNMFWSFQNSTVEMKYVEDNHETRNTFGNYRIDDNTLFITFPDASRPPLPGLRLKAEGENAIQIVRLTGSEMTLAYDTSPEDADNGTAATVILQLRKW